MQFEPLLPYAKTANQKLTLERLQSGLSYDAVAELSGINVRNVYRTVERVKQIAAKAGYSPTHDMTHPAPDGFFVKGVSTYYGEDGQPKGQWVKTNIDQQRQQELFNQMVEAVSETLPREKPTDAPRNTLSDLLNLFVITDYHLGMLSHSDESGDDWDMSIAENLLLDWFQAAIEQSPAAEHAIFAQLGDFLHYDSLSPVTPSHGHVLDAAARYHQIVKSAIKCIRKIIHLLLEKHQHVTVIMAEGNHDLASSVWLREWLSVMYENEPRITIDTRPDPYYCVEWGQTSLFFHHGHLKKISSIDDVFAGKFREVFGRTLHSYAHMGHLHHIDVKETPLMVIEQHRTLAAPDAYAARGGWLSGRDAKVITYSKQFGEVARQSISSQMLVENTLQVVK